MNGNRLVKQLARRSIGRRPAPTWRLRLDEMAGPIRRHPVVVPVVFAAVVAAVAFGIALSLNRPSAWSVDVVSDEVLGGLDEPLDEVAREVPA